MSKVSSVRKTIYKAIGEAERKASRTTFAAGKRGVDAGKKKRKRRPGAGNAASIVLKPSTTKKGYHVDQKGRHYRVVEMPSGNLMAIREDGARFKLGKNGRWVLVKGS